MGEKLEACPFCGGQARLFPVIMPFDADCDTITVQCVNCDAMGGNVLVDQDVHGICDLPELEAEAIAAWNTRATPDRSDDALAEENRAAIIEQCAAEAERQAKLNANARRDRADDELAFEFEGLGAVIASAIRKLAKGGRS